ncbi:SGNH/GDSL hydrolase family protein [Nonomuraea phyllanthi]|uniref:hypothetical protein n=1 Tax=Nonomuraea phyllanthi TaxID=2219224 RepID=UPI00188561DA|nr:hypothetical protein [Nonomuraea phyllanthi]
MARHAPAPPPLTGPPCAATRLADRPARRATSITSPPRERLPNQVGPTHDEVRTAVADAVRTLRSCGETRLHLIDGPGVLGPGDAHLLLDDALHPDADGYRLMADRLTPRLATIAAH